ncbi:MAG: hypothetical protein HYX96_00345 [Chloroflexi bacterium]|nr:hypothetical protein [Chloroflexota bacterium]
MFARVSTIMGKPGQIDEVVRFFKQPDPPELAAMKGAYMLVNRKTGKILTMTLWDTEADMAASAAAASQMRGQAAGKAAAPEPVVELYEVAVKQ